MNEKRKPDDDEILSWMRIGFLAGVLFSVSAMLVMGMIWHFIHNPQ